MRKLALVLLVACSSLSAQTVIYNYQNPYGSYGNPYDYQNTPSFSSSPYNVFSNELPNRTESDRQIVSEIENRLRDDYDLARYADSIEIYSLNGHVSLQGRINSDMARLRIESKAKGVSGVRQVSNGIVVDKTN